MARKATFGTRTKLTASVADLGSVVRLNSLNYNSISFSFVLNETLQLVETPITDPIVHSFTTPLLSYAFEVFHNDLVSIKAGNNLFTDVMIHPSHVAVFSSRKLFEKPYGTPSAFGLKFTTQEPKPSFSLLNLSGIEKMAVRSDCQVIDFLHKALMKSMIISYYYPFYK